MTRVIKANGKEEAFSSSKLRLSIAKALKEADIVGSVSGQIISEIRRKKTVKASDIRREVLSRLRKKCRAAAESWEKYDRRKK